MIKMYNYRNKITYIHAWKTAVQIKVNYSRLQIESLITPFVNGNMLNPVIVNMGYSKRRYFINVIS